MAELLVYALGDSVMWGQGLNDENKFATRVSASLAEARGRTPRLELRAHSGAKIKSTREERKNFVDLFPHLFTTDAENEFIGPEGAAPDFVPDERPADLDRLHGEIPRAFPTIHHQLRSIPDADAERVDVLLLAGGANDLDFQSVLTQEDFLNALDDDYKRIFHDDVFELITAARRRCPNAQIVFVGYYSAFSPDSRFSAMKDLFLELEKKKGDYQVFRIIRVLSPVLGFALDEVLGISERIDDAIALARATSEAGESRAHYWIRRAITEINERSALRGPGVTFAAPSFRPVNCMFGSRSLLWQRFEVDELDDDQQDQRAAACPRNDRRDRMESLLSFGSNNIITDDALIALNNDLDGPRSLRTELQRLAETHAAMGPQQFKESKLADMLRDEVDRIDLTRIASLFHPNHNGAARYASRIRKRAEELRQVSLRQRLLDFLPPTQRSTPPAVIEVGRMIRRFGLDPAVGLKACLAHAEPDVIAVAVRTDPKSEPIIPLEVFLDLGDAGSWKLRHLPIDFPLLILPINPHFRPGTRDFFTIDVAGHLQVGDITRAAIKLDRTLTGLSWRPQEVTLSIDGREVLRRTFAPPPEVNSILDLHFPA